MPIKNFDRHGVHEIKYYPRGIVFKNKTYIIIKKIKKLTNTITQLVIMSNIINSSR